MSAGIRSETFKTSDGCVIAYVVRPARAAGAPRAALIHSLALDGSVWNGVAAKLDGQAELLTYDCRGHGRSERRAMRFTAELFARDLAELLEHLGWPSAVIAGCSMGGCVAQAFAGIYPMRTACLALIDTTAWYGASAPKQWRERADAARLKGLGALAEFQMTRWFSDRFRATRPETAAAATKVFLANDVDCYAASCEMLGEADLRPYLASLRMPVSIAVGEEDYATPVAMARQLHEAIARSTLTLLPGARHLTPIECPDEIASILLALLARDATVGAEASSP